MKNTIGVKNMDGHSYDVNVYAGKRRACYDNENVDGVHSCPDRVTCDTCPFYQNNMEHMEHTQEEVTNIIRNSNEYSTI